MRNKVRVKFSVNFLKHALGLKKMVLRNLAKFVKPPKLCLILVMRKLSEYAQMFPNYLFPGRKYVHKIICHRNHIFKINISTYPFILLYQHNRSAIPLRIDHLWKKMSVIVVPNLRNQPRVHGPIQTRY